jgi:hypothetical protein
MKRLITQTQQFKYRIITLNVCGGEKGGILRERIEQFNNDKTTVKLLYDKKSFRRTRLLKFFFPRFSFRTLKRKVYYHTSSCSLFSSYRRQHCSVLALFQQYQQFFFST